MWKNPNEPLANPISKIWSVVHKTSQYSADVQMKITLKITNVKGKRLISTIDVEVEGPVQTIQV